jgi:hypothetical protein
VYSAQFAPDIDRLLLTFGTDGVLVDQAGEQHALVQWRVAEYEAPHTDWLNAGKCFFLVARETADSKTRISFYSGVDGVSIGAYDLDPRDLVPYHWEDYVELARDSFSLISVDVGFRSVGSLLDTWSSVKFDKESNTLFLSVFRPVSAPYREGDELVCKIKDSWIAVELDPG